MVDFFGHGIPQHAGQRARALRQRLMLTSTEPLSQIALLCGLADQAHLSKLFRRMLGQSPSAWRRRNSTGTMEDNDRLLARRGQAEGGL
ncbi:MAG: helix-turn-helix domain-containing protein [Phyllobacterium sp.]